jgi:hypothetical protein
MIYFPFAGGRGTTLVVRTAGRPEAAIAAVRRAALELDPGVPVMDARPLAARVDDHLAAERLLAALCTAFGALAAGLWRRWGCTVCSPRASAPHARARHPPRARRDARARRGSVLRGAAGLVLPAGRRRARHVRDRRVLARFLYGVGPFDPRTVALAAAALGAVAVGAGRGAGAARRTREPRYGPSGRTDAAVARDRRGADLPSVDPTAAPPARKNRRRSPRPSLPNDS